MSSCRQCGREIESGNVVCPDCAGGVDPNLAATASMQSEEAICSGETDSDVSLPLKEPDESETSGSGHEEQGPAFTKRLAIILVCVALASTAVAAVIVNAVRQGQSATTVVVPPFLDSSPKLNPSDTLKALDAASKAQDEEEWDKYWDATAVAESLVQPLRGRLENDPSWDVLVARAGSESAAGDLMDGHLTAEFLETSIGRSPWFKSGLASGYTTQRVTTKGDEVTLTLDENGNGTTLLVMEPRDVDGEQKLVVVSFDNESFNENFVSGFAEVFR